MKHAPGGDGGRRVQWVLTVLTLVLAAVTLAGCGASEQKRLAAARDYLNARDAKSATLELKTVLQENPQSADGRLLLGQALYLSGDWMGAEQEFRRALAAGADLHAVAPLLSATLVNLHRYDEVVHEFGGAALPSPQATAELKQQVVTARMATGDLTNAREEIDAGLALLPEHRGLLELHARLLSATGHKPEALEVADGLLRMSPDDAAAWVLKGDVLAEAGAAQAGAALDAYRKALALQGKLVSAHAGLISALLRAGDHGAARRQWQALSAAQPRHIQTRFFEALIALQESDARRAREIAQDLLRIAPDNPRLLTLSGQAEMLAGSLAQAEALLVKASMRAPAAEPPRRLLAQVYLRQGAALRALDTLQPLLTSAPGNAAAWTLAGHARLLQGDVPGAESAFQRAAKIKPSNAEARTGLALAQIRRGQVDSGLAALELVARSGADADADLPLLTHRIQRRDWAAALGVIERMAARDGASAQPDLLRGWVQAQRGDAAAARAAWEAALQKSPSFLPAASALADLDIAQGRADAARARLQALVKMQPKDAALRVRLADVIGRAGGGKADVVAQLREAIALKPDDADIRVTLVDYALRSADHELALTTAQAAAVVLPQHPEVLDRLGLALQAGGDARQAAHQYQRAATLQPTRALPHLRLAELHLRGGNATAARQSARRALELEPDGTAAQRIAVLVAVQGGDIDGALKLARAVQTSRKAEAAGWLLEAEILTGASRHEQALGPLRRAVAIETSSDTARLLHRGLLAAGRSAEAAHHAVQWLARRPKDHAFLLHLAAQALEAGDPEGAQAQYQRILADAPNNLEALNNLAQLKAERQQPGAVALAERAVKLAPNRPPLMDTLAQSYAAEGRLKAALDLQEQAVTIAPDQPEFRLTLARLQLQAGQKQSARENLIKLAKYGPQFARQAEVNQLLSAAGG